VSDYPDYQLGVRILADLVDLAKQATLSSLEAKAATEATLGTLAKETTLSSLETKAATEASLSSINGKIPSKTPAGNLPTSLSEQAIAYLLSRLEGPGGVQVEVSGGKALYQVARETYGVWVAWGGFPMPAGKNRFDIPQYIKNPNLIMRNEEAVSVDFTFYQTDDVTLTRVYKIKTRTVGGGEKLAERFTDAAGQPIDLVMPYLVVEVTADTNCYGWLWGYP